MVQKSLSWLSEDVCPLWLKNGFDSNTGAFEECLSLTGQPVNTPRRLMVQARQIFSFRLAAKLGVCDSEKVAKIIEGAAENILNNYSLDSGAFAHSISSTGQKIDDNPDLYGQAFALFGLAHAYAVNPRSDYEDRAIQLMGYLNNSRKAAGGYTEITKNGILYQSNPHMHLFEAFISWMEVSTKPIWNDSASEIINLCTEKFIDPTTQLLAEHFNSDWSIQKDGNRFIFEPGHQFEWAWLMGKFEKLTGRNFQVLRHNLVNKSESYGIDPLRKCVYDEVWSDGTPKLRTSRFWPQTERIKAVLQLAEESTSAPEKMRMIEAADEAILTLFRFFESEQRGLWFDRWLEDGSFQIQPAKASSLYHIIAALHDYVKIRPRL